MKLVRLAVWQKVAASVALSVATVGLLTESPARHLFDGVEDRLVDARMIVRGPTRVRSPIVLVLIDDSSALHFGFRSPLPRSLLAELIDSAARKGAAVVGVDVLLDASYAHTGGPLDRLLAADDARLAKALRTHASKVVVATVPAELANTHAPPHLGQNPQRNPFPMIAHQGHSYVSAGAEDIVRWMNLGNDGRRDSFAGEILKVYRARRRIGAPDPIPPGTQWVRINYPGPPTRLDDREPTFPVYSWQDALRAPAEAFNGQIVLIGSGMEELGDMHLTPFSTSANHFARAYGVELHAVVLNTLLTDSSLREPPRLPLTALHIAGAVLGALVVLFLGLTPAIAATTTILLAWIAASLALFVRQDWVVPIAATAAAWIACWLLCAALRFATETRYNAFLRSNFKKYVPPSLVDQIVADPRLLDLGGEAREVSVLFSDLQGFTSLSEKLPPRELVAILNTYLEKMADVVFDEQGTVDKYEGDAVMAVFGAPIGDEHHADQACRTALRMQDAIAELNLAWRAQGLPQLVARIGVNSGVVVAGNIGSKLHVDYTVIGDAVNLASRLEGLNKAFGTRVIVGMDTHRKLQGQYETRELGRIVVKGKRIPTTVFQVMTKQELAACQDPDRLRGRYAEGLSHFYAARFREAAGIFDDVASAQRDAASEFLADQARYLMANRPAPDWNGAIEMHSK